MFKRSLATITNILLFETIEKKQLKIIRKEKKGDKRYIYNLSFMLVRISRKEMERKMSN